MFQEPLIHSRVGVFCNGPDSKVHGANMGPIWDRQDPCGPHVGPMNFAIWRTHGCTSVHAISTYTIYASNNTHNKGRRTIVELGFDVINERAG